MKTMSTYLTLLFAGLGVWFVFFDTKTKALNSLRDHGRLEATTDTIKWNRPRFSDREEERHQMVTQDIEQRGVKNPEVLSAMRNVPRHLFVPEKYQVFAYHNRPLPIGNNQTISQPLVVGYMTEMLELKAGKKVLEIGTGSGYQAAVLSELTPYVFTIEIVEALGRQARSRLRKLGYSTIKVKIGDGYKGWPEYAPFDAIILTAAPDEIPKPLIEQLAPGGVLVAPLGSPGETQFLTRVTKAIDGKIHVQRKLPVRFVPMTGKAQEQ